MEGLPRRIQDLRERRDKLNPGGYKRYGWDYNPDQLILLLEVD